MIHMTSTIKHPEQRRFCDQPDHGTGTDAEADRYCYEHHTVQLPISMTPHAYVSNGISHHRTCGRCGIGANASVHKIS
jgi:hypothetical protein